MDLRCSKHCTVNVDSRSRPDCLRSPNTVREAFLECREMDASLGDRLDAFADSLRRIDPAFAGAVDRLVGRLQQAQGWARRAQSRRSDAALLSPRREGTHRRAAGDDRERSAGRCRPPRTLVPVLPHQHAIPGRGEAAHRGRGRTGGCDRPRPATVRRPDPR